MEVLQSDYSKPAPDVVERAVEILKTGGVIIYPTDTVYGLGSIIEDVPVNRIREIKGRSGSSPFSLAFSDADMVRDYGLLDQEVEWSGKTYILEKTEKTPNNVTSGLPTVGCRVFEEGIIHEICEKLGAPIVTTSANITGQDAPKNISQIPEEVKSNVDLVLDCGDCILGKPSTIIDLTQDGKVLRE